MHCEHCGQVAAQDARFCYNCGAAQAQEHQAAHAPLPQPVAQARQPKSINLGVVLVAILLVAGVVSYFVARNTGRGNSWDDWDREPRQRAATAQQLLDNPDYYYNNWRVDLVVSGTIASVERLEAVYTYGSRVFEPRYAIRIKDASGPLVVLVHERDITRQSSFVPGKYIRFYGWLWGIYEQNGETLPYFDAFNWYVTQP